MHSIPQVKTQATLSKKQWRQIKKMEQDIIKSCIALIRHNKTVCKRSVPMPTHTADTLFVALRSKDHDIADVITEFYLEVIKNAQSESMQQTYFNAFFEQADKNGQFPIHLALQNGHYTAVKRMVGLRPALTKQRNTQGKIPVEAIQVQDTLSLEQYQLLDHLFCAEAYLALSQEDHKQLAFLLKAAPRLILVQNTSYSLVHTALCSTESCANLFINHCLNVLKEFKDGEEKTTCFNHLFNQVNSQGACPIHLAAKYHPNLALILAKAYPEMGDQVDKNGRTVLHLTLCHKHFEAFAALFEALPNSREAIDAKGSNVLHYAILLGDQPSIGVIQTQAPSLAMQPDQKGNLPIHLAAKKGNTAIFLAALGDHDLQRMLSTQDAEGNTPLHLATEREHTAIVYFILTRNPTVVTKLLAIPNSRGFTPAFWAIECDCSESLIHFCHLPNSPIIHKAAQLRTIKNPKTPKCNAILKAFLSLLKHQENDSTGDAIAKITKSGWEHFLYATPKALKALEPVEDTNIWQSTLEHAMSFQQLEGFKAIFRSLAKKPSVFVACKTFLHTLLDKALSLDSTSTLIGWMITCKSFCFKTQKPEELKETLCKALSSKPPTPLGSYVLERAKMLEAHTSRETKQAIAIILAEHTAPTVK